MITAFIQKNSEDEQNTGGELEGGAISDQGLPVVQNVAVEALPAYFVKFESEGLKKTCTRYIIRKKLQAINLCHNLILNQSTRSSQVSSTQHTPNCPYIGRVWGDPICGDCTTTQFLMVRFGRK